MAVLPVVGQDAMKPAGIDELAVLQGRVMEYNRQIFDRLSGSHTREGSRAEIVVGPVERSYMKQMAAALGRLPLSYQESGGQRMRMQTLKRYCRELGDKLGVFSDSGHFICWMEKGENGRLALCAVPMELEQILFQDIWSRPIPAIITSGTMSVRGDFTHFKKMTGIQLAAPARVMEYQRTLYEDFDSYRRDIIIPEMLIKLRQWFGRGIRREEDTAVFSILDNRASLRGRYRAEILDTLPAMPVADRLSDVAEFIIRKKADSYFMDEERK